MARLYQKDVAPYEVSTNGDDPGKKISQVIYRMVIWDESKEAVFRTLEANGITGAKAQELYDLARADRISSIRMQGLRRTSFGLLLIVCGVGSILIFGKASGTVSGRFVGGCLLVAGFGLWKLVNGLLDFALARTKRGSLADEN